MKDNDIKILINMAESSLKIKEKDTLELIDYFYIFNLIEGYEKTKEFFSNREKIDTLLEERVDETTIFDLLRIARNQYAHSDKTNGIRELLILQTQVERQKIYIIVQEITKEIENIYSTQLNNDELTVISHSRPMLLLFEFIKYALNNRESNNEIEQELTQMINPIFDEFNYEKSTLEEYEAIAKKIIKVIKSRKFKDLFIKRYDEKAYIIFQKIIMDDCDENDFINLIEHIKIINK